MYIWSNETPGVFPLVDEKAWLCLAMGWTESDMLSSAVPQ